MNRASDPQYNAMKEYTVGIADACWYIPCGGTSPFLVASDQNVASVECPSSVCQTIINSEAGNDSNIDDNYIYFSCDLNVDNGGDGDGGGGGDSEVPPSTGWGTMVTDKQLTRFFTLFFSNIILLMTNLII
jgi:hypothetical protein